MTSGAYLAVHNYTGIEPAWFIFLLHHRILYDEKKQPSNIEVTFIKKVCVHKFNLYFSCDINIALFLFGSRHFRFGFHLSHNLQICVNVAVQKSQMMPGYHATRIFGTYLAVQNYIRYKIHNYIWWYFFHLVTHVTTTRVANMSHIKQFIWKTSWIAVKINRH